MSLHRHLVPPLPPITTLPSGTLPSTAMSDTTNSTATSLMSLLLPHSEAAKESNIFIGDGLPSIPPKLYRRMLNWSYIDMAELQPLGSIECQNQEPDPARYVILPGLELAKAKKKVVLDIHTWIHMSDQDLCNRLLPRSTIVNRLCSETLNSSYKLHMHLHLPTHTHTNE